MNQPFPMPANIRVNETLVEYGFRMQSERNILANQLFNMFEAGSDLEAMLNTICTDYQTLKNASSKWDKAKQFLNTEMFTRVFNDALADNYSDTQHFFLIKRDGFNAKQQMITATEGIRLLCDAGFWPLWKGTHCVKMVKTGDTLFLYTAGRDADAKHIIGMAAIAGIEDWSREHKNSYPLFLDGTPHKVLRLDLVKLFKKPLPMNSVIHLMSFAPKNLAKWGMSMMGGMRSMQKTDYLTLMKHIECLQQGGKA